MCPAPHTCHPALRGYVRHFCPSCPTHKQRCHRKKILTCRRQRRKPSMYAYSGWMNSLFRANYRASATGGPSRGSVGSTGSHPAAQCASLHTAPGDSHFPVPPARLGCSHPVPAPEALRPKSLGCGHPDSAAPAYANCGVQSLPADRPPAPAGRGAGATGHCGTHTDYNIRQAHCPAGPDCSVRPTVYNPRSPVRVAPPCRRAHSLGNCASPVRPELYRVPAWREGASRWGGWREKSAAAGERGSPNSPEKARTLPPGPPHNEAGRRAHRTENPPCREVGSVLGQAAVLQKHLCAGL